MTVRLRDAGFGNELSVRKQNSRYHVESRKVGVMADGKRYTIGAVDRATLRRFAEQLLELTDPSGEDKA